ncbi:hypothetical protein [Agarivorans gilvus]|jgi:hypothetical protein|uniref:Outer membrane protein beta-barrel domain-containing protein n=1 Tax=Agarivorans gilvus TaxID=680279 RepID=A0ABQ1I0G2_9ALTE|nr:hypothetical protein [Agarivorans gilvus]GGB00782.1 hypothetical protein GCM10007414_12440 [Agarivorans gilvus]
MKLRLALGAALLASLPAHADLLGLTLSTHIAQTDSEPKASSAWQGDLSLRFKHPIPLVPNVAVVANKRKQGDPADGSSYQAELYYNLFDTAGLYVDLGAGYEGWESANSATDGSNDGEQIYAVGRVTWRFPGSGLGIESDLKLSLSEEDYQANLFRAGLNYQFFDSALGGLTLSGGYQYEDIATRHYSTDNSGAYLGLAYKF